ncbi:hypothetical protein AB1Y20_010595 [Prymnesium parvum]|uniref:Uncharacterized protein n=1 Tax=Prymnesium parvum TaxID=97485 RepID=A0AB34IP48_PRYPA
MERRRRSGLCRSRFGRCTPENGGACISTRAIRVRGEEEVHAPRRWSVAITAYMEDEGEAACRGVYGTDEAFLCGRHSPLVRDGEHCLQTHPDVEVFATAHKCGGLLPAPPTKARPCRFELSELDGGLTGAGDPSVEHIMGNAHSLARDAKRACFARVHAHWTAPCIALFEVRWLPSVTRPHVR